LAEFGIVPQAASNEAVRGHGCRGHDRWLPGRHLRMVCIDTRMVGNVAAW